MFSSLTKYGSWTVLLFVASFLALSNPGVAQESGEDAEIAKEKEKAKKGPLVIPTPKATDVGLKVPEGVTPKREKDELLLYTPPKGKPMVVKLHATIGDTKLVKIPTGKLLQVKASQTKPTTQPFVAATTAEIAQAVREEGFDKYKIVEAHPYVFVYACSEAFYMHTRSILESLYPGIMASLEGWGLDPQEPETPLVVVITPNRKAFDTYEEMPEGVAAYYSILTHYIILYEDTDLAFAAPEFGLKQGAYTIAHEGVHQILAATGVQDRLARWPMWISEGLPEYFCPLKVNSRLVRTKSAELPERTLKWIRAGAVNDLRMWDLLQTPTSDAGHVIQALVSSPRLNANGYSLAWGMTHYLATKKKNEFQAYLQDVRKIKAFDTKWDNLGRAPDPLFVKHFGDQFSVTEYAVAAHLNDKKMQTEYRDPMVYQTHYVIKRILKKGRAFDTVMVITLSPEAAKKWKEEEEAKLAAANETARFYTIVCETRDKAEFQIRKVMGR